MLARLKRRQRCGDVQRRGQRHDDRVDLRVVNQFGVVVVARLNLMLRGRFVAAFFVGVGHGHKARAVDSGERRHVRPTTDETAPDDAHPDIFHDMFSLLSGGRN